MGAQVVMPWREELAGVGGGWRDRMAAAAAGLNKLHMAPGHGYVGRPSPSELANALNPLPALPPPPDGRTWKADAPGHSPGDAGAPDDREGFGAVWTRLKVLAVWRRELPDLAVKPWWWWPFQWRLWARPWWDHPANLTRGAAALATWRAAGLPDGPLCSESSGLPAPTGEAVGARMDAATWASLPQAFRWQVAPRAAMGRAVELMAAAEEAAGGGWTV